MRGLVRERGGALVVARALCRTRHQQEHPRIALVRLTKLLHRGEVPLLGQGDETSEFVLLAHFKRCPARLYLLVVLAGLRFRRRQIVLRHGHARFFEQMVAPGRSFDRLGQL